MAKTFCNFLVKEQLKASIRTVKNHESVYKEGKYWKKEAVIANHDLLGEPNDNPKVFVLHFVPPLTPLGKYARGILGCFGGQVLYQSFEPTRPEVGVS
jgi:hypothetical protein